VRRGAVECGAENNQGSEGLPRVDRQLDTRRIYTALVFAPLFYLLVRYLPAIVFFAFVVAVAMSSLEEFYRLYFRNESIPMEIILGLGSLALLLMSMQWPDMMSERDVILLMLAAVFLYRLSARKPTQSLVDSAILVFGVVYIGLTLGHLLRTRALEGGEFLIFFVVLVTWAADTGAYYVGTTIGRRQLAPIISPNKTIEGLIGGLVLAIAMAVVARAWFLPSFSLADCLATGLLLTMAGVLGDLSESALKRSAGVKDSGTLIPAHGGILDRVDSLLFTAPAFYYYVALVKT
jgi:phosphatidate cytidylyltransferase